MRGVRDGADERRGREQDLVAALGTNAQPGSGLPGRDGHGDTAEDQARANVPLAVPVASDVPVHDTDRAGSELPPEGAEGASARCFQADLLQDPASRGAPRGLIRSRQPSERRETMTDRGWASLRLDYEGPRV